MNKPRVRLNAQEILNKEFKTGIRGYNQEEVDEFLDIIIQDYHAFNEKIKNLETEIKNLKRITETKQSRTQTSYRTQQVNYDILQRLSNLEKEVFGKKYAES